MYSTCISNATVRHNIFKDKNVCGFKKKSYLSLTYYVSLERFMDILSVGDLSFFFIIYTGNYFILKMSINVPQVNLLRVTPFEI